MIRPQVFPVFLMSCLMVTGMAFGNSSPYSVGSAASQTPPAAAPASIPVTTPAPYPGSEDHAVPPAPMPENDSNTDRDRPSPRSDRESDRYDNFAGGYGQESGIRDYESGGRNPYEEETGGAPMTPPAPPVAAGAPGDYDFYDESTAPAPVPMTPPPPVDPEGASDFEPDGF